MLLFSPEPRTRPHFIVSSHVSFNTDCEILKSCGADITYQQRKTKRALHVCVQHHYVLFTRCLYAIAQNASISAIGSEHQVKIRCLTSFVTNGFLATSLTVVFSFLLLFIIDFQCDELQSRVPYLSHHSL